MAYTAREAALKALAAYRVDNTWSEKGLDRVIGQGNLSARDASLAARLFYGVLENRNCCDWYLQRYVKGSLKKLHPMVLDALRIGVYQIKFMDRIPQSAAVNESVELVKRYSKGAAGLANAVLRKISQGKEVPERNDFASEFEYLSVKYGHPIKLVEKFSEIFGADTEKLLQANNTRPPVSVQTNTCKASACEVEQELISEGISVSEGAIENSFLCWGNVAQTKTFLSGKVMIQDTAARLSVMASGVKKGDTVIDVCAAPGGKSFAAADMMCDDGSILACDIYPQKVKEVQNEIVRLGFSSVRAICHDAKVYDEKLKDCADVVIADVPCSGMGVIRKKPEIRYKSLEECKQLPKLQLDILDTVAKYVKPKGTLLYSTCTIFPEENEFVIEEFLKRHPDFETSDFSLPLSDSKGGMLTLLPHVHGTDGFFICKMVRKAYE